MIGEGPAVPARSRRSNQPTIGGADSASAVIVRKLSHGSKNACGAEAFAEFTSVIPTAAKKRGGSILDALQNLFQSKSHNPPKAHSTAGLNGRKPVINYSRRFATAPRPVIVMQPAEAQSRSDSVTGMSMPMAAVRNTSPNVFRRGRAERGMGPCSIVVGKELFKSRA
jgi:hypothetical protein